MIVPVDQRHDCLARVRRPELRRHDARVAGDGVPEVALQDEAVVRGRRIVDPVVDGGQAAVVLRFQDAACGVLARDVGGRRGRQRRGTQCVQRLFYRRVEQLAKLRRVAPVVAGHQGGPVAAGVGSRVRMGGVQNDVALRDPVLAGDAAPDASGVLEAEAREVGRHEDQRLAPGVAERERARPDRVVDTLGEPVATAERHVGTEPRQMDPPETVRGRGSNWGTAASSGASAHRTGVMSTAAAPACNWPADEAGAARRTTMSAADRCAPAVRRSVAAGQERITARS